MGEGVKHEVEIADSFGLDVPGERSTDSPLLELHSSPDDLLIGAVKVPDSKTIDMALQRRKLRQKKQRTKKRFNERLLYIYI